MWNFSLLYPGSEARTFALPPQAVNDLSLDFLLEHLCPKAAEREMLRPVLLSLPVDTETVHYRRSIFEDLSEAGGLCESFADIFDAMEFYGTDRNIGREKNATMWDFLCRLKDLENYCTAILKIRDCLAEHVFRSEGMKKLQSHIEDIYRDSGFRELQADIEEACSEVSSVKSMTLGVNFDESMLPQSIGIVSMNTFPIREQGVLERYLKFHKKSEELTMLSTSKKPDSDELQLMSNMVRLLERMLPKVVKTLSSTLNRHVDRSGEAFVKLKDEFLFYRKFIELRRKTESTGLSVCFPEIGGGGIRIDGFYNPKLALARAEGLIDHEIVTNDLRFDEKDRVMILTGPNRGGKTVFTQGLGLCFYLCQQGVFVPGSRAELPLTDGIFTHFPADENSTLSLGRLGEEASRFGDICTKATEKSLLLFNESFSTTSHQESLYIAGDVLRFLLVKGCLVVFNTHMHELGEDAEKFSETPEAKGRAFSAVMGSEGGERSYRVERKRPDGQSFARDIAKKYGITFEQLMESEREKKGL